MIGFEPEVCEKKIIQCCYTKTIKLYSYIIRLMKIYMWYTKQHIIIKHLGLNTDSYFFYFIFRSFFTALHRQSDEQP